MCGRSERISTLCHADADSILIQFRDIFVAAVLASSVGVVDEPAWDIDVYRGKRHPESLQRIFRLQRRAYRPADYLVGIGISDEGQITYALAGLHISYISGPPPRWEALSRCPRSPCYPICSMTVCYNQTARTEDPGISRGTYCVAALPFGARFFSHRDVERLLCQIYHRAVGFGAEFLQLQCLAQTPVLCLQLMTDDPEEIVELQKHATKYWLCSAIVANNITITED